MQIKICRDVHFQLGNVIVKMLTRDSRPFEGRAGQGVWMPYARAYFQRPLACLKALRWQQHDAL